MKLVSTVYTVFPRNAKTWSDPVNFKRGVSNTSLAEVKLLKHFSKFLLAFGEMNNFRIFAKMLSYFCEKVTKYETLLFAKTLKFTK